MPSLSSTGPTVTRACQGCSKSHARSCLTLGTQTLRVDRASSLSGNVPLRGAAARLPDRRWPHRGGRLQEIRPFGRGRQSQPGRFHRVSDARSGFQGRQPIADRLHLLFKYHSSTVYHSSVSCGAKHIGMTCGFFIGRPKPSSAHAWRGWRRTKPTGGLDGVTTTVKVALVPIGGAPGPTFNSNSRCGARAPLVTGAGYGTLRRRLTPERTEFLVMKRASKLRGCGRLRRGARRLAQARGRFRIIRAIVRAAAVPRLHRRGNNLKAIADPSHRSKENRLLWLRSL